MLRNALLFCGILSSLFYAAMDVIGGTRWQSYSWMSQEFSRLSAIGAPSRPLHLVLNPIYTLLVIAFGVGVWLSAGQRLAPRVIGAALIAYSLVSFIWPQFFPEDLSRPVGALTNTMHIVITIVTVLSWILILSFGASLFGKGFRIYSLLTLAAVVVFGGLAGSQGPRLAAGLPTPWLGLVERLNIYSFMVWAIVLAIMLMRADVEPLPPA